MPSRWVHEGEMLLGSFDDAYALNLSSNLRELYLSILVPR